MKKLNTEFYLIFFLLLYVALVSFVHPSFFRWEILFDLLRSSTGNLILSMGVLLVLLSGCIDLSFASIAIFAGYSTVRLMIAFPFDNLILAFLTAIVMGGVLGGVNGLLVGYLKLPSMVATLGTGSLFWGILTTFVGTKSVNASELPESLIRLGSLKWVFGTSFEGEWGLSVFVLFSLSVILITIFILHCTILGRSILALGNNEEAAFRIGIKTSEVYVFVFVYIGILSGVMGLLYASEIRWINSISLAGSELTTIAAVVIGGASITGGVGSIAGSVAGVFTISLLSSTLIFLGVPSSWNNFFIGFMILLSVSFTSIQLSLKRKSALQLE